MIRGAQKKMIVVKTEGSRLFDEAYFILRREVEKHHCDKRDLVGEAEKILQESAPGVRVRRARVKWGFFLLGLLFGGLCFFLGLLAKKAGLPG